MFCSACYISPVNERFVSSVWFLQAGVDSEGTIQYMNVTAYEDAGIAFNDNAILPFMLNSYNNIYSSEAWHVKLNDVKTDKPCNCWTRGPGK